MLAKTHRYSSVMIQDRVGLLVKLLDRTASTYKVMYPYLALDTHKHFRRTSSPLEDAPYRNCGPAQRVAN
jgi:hypothetical protein